MQKSVETIRVPTTHGVEVAAYHFGGQGPSLFVGHCTGFHVRAYNPLIERFKEYFDVWGMDFRGHGASTPPTSGDPAHMDWTHFADDLVAVLDTVGLDSIRVFAHSLGGAVSLLAETKRPGLIEAAWLFEPIVFPASMTPKNDLMAEGARNRRAVFASKAEALARFASRPPLGRLRADVLASYVESGFDDTDDGSVTLACAPETEAQTYLHATIPVSAIEGLAPRTTIGAGLVDAHRSPDEWSLPIAQALANGSHVVYDDLTHFGPLEAPDRIASDAIAFLS